jgi:hypothetical protein
MPVQPRTLVHLVAPLLLAIAAAVPARATPVSLVGRLPSGTGGTQITNVSADGKRLLVTTSNPGALWTNEVGGQAVEVAQSGIPPLANQSPSGDYIAWVPRRAYLKCARKLYVAPSATPAASKSFELPTAYRHRSFTAVAVADDGTVTAGVGDCSNPFAQYAVLTGSLTQSELETRMRYTKRSLLAQRVISNNGRVFVGCGVVTKRGKRVAEMTVIDSRAPQATRTTTLSQASGLPTCGASDAGAAVLTSVSPGRPARLAVAWIEGARTHKFTTASNCETGQVVSAVSPDGGSAILGLLATRINCRKQGASVVNKNGRIRNFQIPFRRLTQLDGRKTANSWGWGGFFAWDPFAPAVVQTQASQGVAGVFNATSLRESPLLKVRKPDSDASIAPCFLRPGRILFTGAGDKGSPFLSVTDEDRARASSIDTRDASTISSASCEAVATTGAVFLASTDGRLYAADDNAIDGSALTVR